MGEQLVVLADQQEVGFVVIFGEHLQEVFNHYVWFQIRTVVLLGLSVHNLLNNSEESNLDGIIFVEDDEPVELFQVGLL